MTHRYIKIGITAAVLVLAFTGLLWSTLRDGTEYYKHVDEVMANPQAVGRQAAAAARLRGRRTRSCVKPDTLEYRFKVQNNRRSVDRRASYKGIVPDTFKDREEEAEVVLKGKLTPDGFHVDPNGVMAKCPSKYEAAEESRA